MSLLWLITLFNGIANNKTFLEYRWSVAGVPINIFDLLMFIGLIWALFFSTRRRFPVDRMHRAFPWTIAFLAIGALGGFMGSMSNGAYTYEILAIGRNYL